MNGSLFTRLYATITIFIFTIFFINFYFTLKTYKEHQILASSEILVKNIQNLEKSIIANPGLDLPALKKFIEETARIAHIDLAIFNESGVSLIQTGDFPDPVKFFQSSPAQSVVSLKVPLPSNQYKAGLMQQSLYITLKVAGKFSGYISTSVFLPGINSFLSVYKKNIFYTALVIFVLSLSWTFLLTRSVANPLEKLTHATRQIAAGNFDVRIPPVGSGEISELADNLRIMTRELKSLFSNISHQKEELSNIIEAVQEKVLIIATDGIILSTNRGFDEIFQTGDSRGKHYSKAIAGKEIINIIERTINKKVSVMEELIIDDRVFLCSSACMKEIKEAVLVLRDISDLKNLENIKRDLIANASHELRTPLTAIKGFLETLKDDLTGQNLKYLEIMERHTDRLIFIVQDLLILSRLEDQSILPQYQNLILREVIQDTFMLLEKKANQKGLKLRMEGNPDMEIEGDRNQLVQLILNLTDNAIKYTESGEVCLMVDEEPEFAIINIIDTGIGIEKKHLSRLFERFYTVDSSRSRSQGGTGLGLSIVKHVVQNHKGKVEISSVPGTGTTVTVRLPVRQNPPNQPLL